MVMEYVEFQPKSEWKEEDLANILLIYLPAGFQAEQLKVRYIGSTRIVRVVGERLIAYNMSSRFNQDFPVPKNCEVYRIQARLQPGVLTITMPKATVTPAPKQAKATQEASIPPPEAAPKTDGKEGSGDEKVTASQIPQRISTDDLKSQKDGKEDPATNGSASQKQKNGNEVEGIVSPQEKHEQSLAPAANTTDRRANRKSEEREKPTQQARGKDLSFEQGESSQKRKESLMTTGSDKESGKKRKESMGIQGDDQGGTIKPLMQKENGKNDDDKVSGAADGAEEKQKEEVNARMTQKLKELKEMTAAAAKKTVQGLAMELRSEERQSMVNMGLTVLVLAALGAYIYYSCRSSGTGGRAED